MQLDPAAQSVLDLIRESGRQDFESLSPAEARAVAAASRTLFQPDPPPVAELRDIDAPGPTGRLRLRLYRGTTEGMAPALVYFHGGGWVLGDLDTHDGICRQFAIETGGTVISVDYALAPERKFPAAVEDALAATRWIMSEAATLGLDPRRIAIGGDSAGGNLAAVIALMARDGAMAAPCYQMLLYPVTDLSMTLESYRRMAEGYALTAATMRWFRDLYLRDPRDITDWRASPLQAASLAGVAPAYVLTAAYDPLCDEGCAYARRLMEAGISVTHTHMADQMHAFLGMGRLVPAAGRAIASAAMALRTAWAS